MDSRKRVRMSIGPKLPFVPATKRHRCLRFGHDEATGFVEKMTTAQLHNLISREAASKVRLLGTEISSDLIDSPTSVIAEIEDSDNFLSRLRKLETTVVSLKDEISSLKERELATTLIVNEGYSVSTRAFADYVVNSFYQCAGNPGDRRGWLDGKGAVSFVERGGSMQIFDKRVKIDHNLLVVVKKLRSISMKYSKNNCHNFKPVQLAFAFQELADFKPEDPVVKFFNTCFGVSAKSVVKLHSKGKLPAKYFKEYFN